MFIPTYFWTVNLIVMKKILFPFDFSETSLNAFRYALHLADKIDAEIITLHVYEKLTGPFQNYYDVVLANEGGKQWSEFEDYKGEVPKLREIVEQENLTHVNIRHSLQEGDVSDVILKRAVRDKVSYIVMGTKGATGLVETFLGSVTEKIMNLATCAVLAIPEMAKYKPIHKILFLSKFKDSDKPRLAEVQKIAKLVGAKIKVLHVKKHHDDDEAELINQFKSAMSGSDIHYQILASNDVEGTINDYIQIEHIDVIVMPVHHKNFFTNLFLYSLSRKLVFHSRIPVLGLHAKEHH